MDYPEVVYAGLERCLKSDSHVGELLHDELFSQSSKLQEKVKVEIEEIKTKKTAEQLLTQYLSELGIPRHIRGYHYLRTALLMCVKDSENLYYVTKNLYPYIAKEYKTTSSSVERGIRTAIEIAWSRGNFQKIETMFGYTIPPTKDKPTNSEFLALLTDEISKEIY